MITLDKFTTWALALGAALAIGGSYLLDGQSDEQVERAIAADLQAARRDELRMTLMLKRCYQERGPSAELIQIRGSDDYVCREREIEPTPEHVLHQYAKLGEKK